MQHRWESIMWQYTGEVGVLVVSLVLLTQWYTKPQMSKAEAAQLENERRHVSRDVSATLQYIQEKKAANTVPEALTTKGKFGCGDPNKLFSLSTRCCQLELDQEVGKCKRALQKALTYETERLVREVELFLQQQTSESSKGAEGCGGHGCITELHEVLQLLERVQTRWPDVQVSAPLLAAATALKDQLLRFQTSKLSQLVSLIRPSLLPVSLALLTSILSALPQGLHSFYLYEIQTAAAEGTPESQDKVRKCGAFLLYLSFLHFGLKYIHSMLASCISSRWNLEIQKLAFAKILSLDLSYYDSHSASEMESVLRSASSLSFHTLRMPFDFLQQLLTLLSSLGVLLLRSPRLVLLMSAWVPLHFYVTRKLNVFYINRAMLHFDMGTDSYNTAEVLREIRTVRSFAREDREVNAYAVYQQMSAGKMVGNFWLAWLPNVVTWVKQGVEYLGLWFGCQLIIHGHARGGELLSLVTSIMAHTSSLQTLLTFPERMQQSLVPATRLMLLLDLQPTVEDSLGRGHIPTSSSIRGQIEFDRVSFSYPSRPQQQVLDRLSFVVQPGSTLALVGPSGAGKSSVIRLLQRFYAIKGGEIKVDGVPLSTYNIRWLRSQMAIVDQEPVLFNGTILDNLLYGCREPYPSPAAIESALRQANAWDFVQSFPEQVMTAVGSRGTQLSGGQKQRIAIARALLLDPKILLLDEATSALDSEAEQQVQSALERLMKGRTTLIIAHRLSTVKNSSHILVLQQGRQVECGTHSELLCRPGGVYRSLFEPQLLHDSELPRRSGGPGADQEITAKEIDSKDKDQPRVVFAGQGLEDGRTLAFYNKHSKHQVPQAYPTDTNTRHLKEKNSEGIHSQDMDPIEIDSKEIDSKEVNSKEVDSESRGFFNVSLHVKDVPSPDAGEESTQWERGSEADSVSSSEEPLSKRASSANNLTTLLSQEPQPSLNEIPRASSANNLTLFSPPASPRLSRKCSTVCISRSRVVRRRNRKTRQRKQKLCNALETI
eukprot:g52018.t1